MKLLSGYEQLKYGVLQYYSIMYCTYSEKYVDYIN